MFRVKFYLCIKLSTSFKLGRKHMRILTEDPLRGTEALVGEGHSCGEVGLGCLDEVKVAAAGARHHRVGERIVDIGICG